MTLAAIFLVNAALSFALSLLLASLLGPDGFGRYAIGLSATLVVNTIGFEWLRLSTSRFYGERARTEQPAIRTTLDRLYLAVAAGIVAISAVSAAAGFGIGGSSSLLLAALACGLAYGLCEYKMALSRARFLQRPYAVLAFLRAVLGFVLAAGAALATGDPTLVLVGAALAAAIPILVVAAGLRDPAPPRGGTIDRPLLAQFARYAVPLVAASALYQFIPLANRTILAGRDGFTEAGFFSLASELATRLFQNLGAVLDLVLFQIAVRTEEREGREAAARQIARNAGLVSALVIPAAVGLVSVWPSFEAVFVPGDFRNRIAGTAMLAVPALALFALVQFALNPIFQIGRRTTPVIAAAAVAVAVDLSVLAWWPGLSGAEGFAAAHLAGMAAGTVVIGGLAAASGARLPLSDIGRACLAAAIMAACLWPFRDASPSLAMLLAQSAGGAFVYALMAFALDLADARAAARQAWHLLVVRVRKRSNA